MSYLLAKMVEELVVIVFVSVAVSACIFYLVGFHGQYILFWLVYLVTISIGMGDSLSLSSQYVSTKAATIDLISILPVLAGRAWKIASDWLVWALAE